MMQSGYKRVGLWVPQERVALLKELKAQLVSELDFEHLRDFLACDYMAMVDDPRSSAADRTFARQKLRELGLAAGSEGPDRAKRGRTSRPTASAPSGGAGA